MTDGGRTEREMGSQGWIVRPDVWSTVAVAVMGAVFYAAIAIPVYLVVRKALGRWMP